MTSYNLTAASPLTEPIYLRSGDTLTGQARLADTYRSGFVGGYGQEPDGGLGVIRTEPGAMSPVISNFELVGPPYEWWLERAAEPWIFPARGISLDLSSRARVEHVRVSRMFCGEALTARDYQDLTILDFETRECYAGIGLLWPTRTGNGTALIDGFRGRDMQVIPGHTGMGLSILHPERETGANFIYAEGCKTLRIRHVECAGEGKGIKIWRTGWAQFLDVQTQQLWLGGETPLPPGYHGQLESIQYEIARCVLGGSVYGMSQRHTADAIPLFCTAPTTLPIAIYDSVLVAPRPGAIVNYPDWRFEIASAQLGANLDMKRTRLVDVSGGVEPRTTPGAPRWCSALTGTVTTDPTVTYQRITPQWAG